VCGAIAYMVDRWLAINGYYGGLSFALFSDWMGLAFLWGPVRRQVWGAFEQLMLTVVCRYSLFYVSQRFGDGMFWQLAVLRALAGIGIGGEWAMGGTFVAEEWPENRRRAGAGYMHTVIDVGIFSGGAG